MLWSCELHGFKDCLTDNFQDLKMHEITGLEDECILDCEKPCDLTDSLNFTSSKKWDSIRGKCLLWAGLDKFTNVYESVDWKNGPTNHYMHESCYTTLSSKRALTQAEKRKQKINECSEQSSQHFLPRQAILPRKKTAFHYWCRS